MAELKVAPAAGSEDAEVFLSASEDEAAQPQVVTPELLTALVRQVEFYFSDANLPTDKKLLKQIRKDPEGYVPVKLFANFRKVRALSKDVSIITEALRGASLLQLSQDCKRVKRIMPVPDYDISDIQRRTIVVENLPGNTSPTIESVTEMFRLYGRVKLVRICSRESKGKLPSWLTGSCQNMTGQQHAYVEFEEEEGAILASAALASESEAPDGAVQVRRLLACIAEQRERRSGNGNGSSYGGSTSGGGGCSRKGSRDVSPMGAHRGNGTGGRRTSGGGTSYTASSYSCGGSTWGGCSSSGGAASLDHPSYHHPYHYHSCGGAFETGPSRHGSAGGAMSPSLAHLPPPPPPPPRRSCDSAPASDLLPPASVPTPTLSARASNVYRPPAKRLSDGYTPTITTPAISSGGQPSCASPCGAPVPVSAAVLFSRSLGGSFNSSCGGNSCSIGGVAGGMSAGSTAPCSSASTPVGMPCSPPLPAASSPVAGPSYCSSSYICPSSGVTLVLHSPPLSSRNVSVGGGKPPVHPPSSSCASQGGSAHAVATNSLAEAIAQVQAERRASEAGAKASCANAAALAPCAPATVAPIAALAVTAPVPPPPPPPAAAQTAVVNRPMGPSAPKFCLDLAAGPVSRTRVSVTNVPAAVPAASAQQTEAASFPRSTQAQMVDNVEDFINNILARPAARPSPVTAAPAQAAAVPQPLSRKAPLTVRVGALPPPNTAAATSSTAPLDAAAAVAGILASTLRRPAGPAVTTKAMAASAGATTISSSAPIVIRPTAPQPSTTAVPAPVVRQVVHITAIAVDDSDSADRAAMELFDLDLNGKRMGLDFDVTKIGAKQSVFSAVLEQPQLQQQEPVTITVGMVGVACSSPVKGSGTQPTTVPPSPPTSVTASPSPASNSNKPSNAGKPNGSGSVRPGAKRLSKRDYAHWAAATPGFRAEAASKYGSNGTAASPVPSGAQSPLKHPMGGPMMSPAAVATGEVAASTTTGGSGQQHAAPIWHVARGPDGSRGFAGRVRAPVAAV